MPLGRGLIEANVRALDATAALFARVDDALYRRALGPQIRHALEFYACFLAGLARGRVDYDARAREAALETSRAVARERLRSFASALRALPDADVARPLLVRAEAVAAAEEEWSPSSVRRELEFLLSHTVHHQALIAEMLRARGIDCGAGFGVAPSTLRHRAALALAS